MELNYLSKLEQREQDILKKIPALVTILVGTVDGKLDDQEAHIGKLSTEFRRQNGEKLVQDYFKWVTNDYDEIFKREWEVYQNQTTEERTKNVSDAIAEVNDILPKIERQYARSLVVSWRGLAVAVARASGGLLGRMSVSNEEQHVMGLNMIEID